MNERFPKVIQCQSGCKHNYLGMVRITRTINERIKIGDTFALYDYIDARSTLIVTDVPDIIHAMTVPGLYCRGIGPNDYEMLNDPQLLLRHLKKKDS